LEQLASFASSPRVVERVRDLGRPHDGEANLRSLEYFHEASSRDYETCQSRLRLKTRDGSATPH
jgi:hypothetical protein